MAYPQYTASQASWSSAPASTYGAPGQHAAHISIQPQPTWGGMDYYRAHAPSNYDPAYFNNAWDRVRQFDTAAPAGLGVGVHEAKHWHRRAYGGMSELSIMGPAEIGHAAAYEAYRTCRSMYEVLGPDVERQRERLIGLAVAEAARLLSFTGRANDHYARSAASDAAAHTASYIFYQRRVDDERRGRSRSRAGYDQYEDSEPYYEDDYMARGRSRSRHRSSYGRTRSYSGGGYADSHYGGGPSVSAQMPSYPGSASSVIVPPPGTAMSGASGYSSGYPSASFYPNQFYQQGSPPGSYGGYGVAPPGQAYPTPGVPMGVPLAPSSSGSSAYSYGAPPYMGGVPSTGGMVPGQTIVIHKNKKHRRRHHHRSRSRYAESD